MRSLPRSPLTGPQAIASQNAFMQTAQLIQDQSLHVGAIYLRHSNLWRMHCLLHQGHRICTGLGNDGRHTPSL